MGCPSGLSPVPKQLDSIIALVEALVGIAPVHFGICAGGIERRPTSKQQVDASQHLWKPLSFEPLHYIRDSSNDGAVSACQQVGCTLSELPAPPERTGMFFAFHC